MSLDYLISVYNKLNVNTKIEVKTWGYEIVKKENNEIMSAYSWGKLFSKNKLRNKLIEFLIKKLEEDVK